MRRIRLSKTFTAEGEKLLEQGVPRFGERVVEEKRNLITRTIEQHLAYFPRRTVDPILGICAYPITGAPFVLLYDYDDEELRVHLIIHASADRSLINLSTVEW